MASRAAYGFVRTKSAYRGPDPSIVQDQLLKLKLWYEEFGPAEFAEKFFWILKKSPEKDTHQTETNPLWNKRLIPFRLNAIQRDIHSRLTSRNIFLKPRQGGYTTWMIIMRLLLPAILNPGVGCLLISQNASYATAHFSMMHRAFRYFGMCDPFNILHPSNKWALNLHQHLLHPRYSSRKELIFDALDSRVICASAEVEEVGQGLTVQHLGCTEVARWEGNPEETLANVKESVPVDGTVDLESTANMMGGYFYEECMRARQGKSEFTFHFHPWYFHEEYTLPDKPVAASSLTGTEKAVIRSAKEQFKIDLDLGRIAWRRLKILSLRHNFAEKYPEDDISCFLLQGNAYFDTEILGYRLREIEGQRPIQIFKRWKMYKKPQAHRNYVIGVDPASGRSASAENLDYAAAVVLDRETGDQCAVYHARIPPEDLAQDMAELGRLYNNALVAVERTGDGGTVMLMMQVANQYANIYKHRDWWKRDWVRQTGGGGAAKGGNKFREIEGWPTSVKTRPIMLNRVAIVIRQTPELIHDVDFVKECLTFVRDEDGKPQAAEGTHDDLVMAMAIANAVRLVVLGYLDITAMPSESYDDNDQPEDEVEDVPESSGVPD